MFWDFFFPSESSCLQSRLWGIRAAIIGSYCVGGSPGIMYGNRRMKTGGGGQEASEEGVAGPERSDRLRIRQMRQKDNIIFNLTEQ